MGQPGSGVEPEPTRMPVKVRRPSFLQVEPLNRSGLPEAPTLEKVEP